MESFRREEIRKYVLENQKQLSRELEGTDRATSLLSFQVEEYEAHLDKKRWLYRISEEAYLLEKILGIRLEKRIEAHLTDSVDSFRKSRGSVLAARKFSRWMKSEIARQNPVGCGVYVIRADIRSYTDQIPLHENSPLWELLKNIGIDAWETSLLKALLRPEIQDPKGNRHRLLGIPTGSCLTPPLANLYLTSFDQVILSHPGIFYSRYGDDLLIAHPDLNALTSALEKGKARLQALGLEFHPDKLKTHFTCPSGSTQNPQAGFSATPHIDYLGIRIHATKGLRLSRDKMREMVRPWIHRLLQTRKLLREAHASPEESAQTLVEISNAYFSPSNSNLTPHLADFYGWVNDETQIREFEDFLARTLSQIIAGVRGTRSYRKISWQTLIKKCGWKSPRHLHRQERA